jgi:serine/threonine protein kinase
MPGLDHQQVWLQLEAQSSPQGYCTGVLSLLEAEFRALALLALADWERLELVDPELFPALGGLQRPSWGSWNFLLQSLRTARKAQLRSARHETRERLERARVLTSVLTLLDSNASTDELAAAQPLAKHRGDKARLKRVGDLLALPIALRNQLAHFPPAGDAEWETVRAVLMPLAQQRAASPLLILTENSEWPSPWFIVDNDIVLAFNGADKDLVPSYASPSVRGPSEAPERAGVFVQSLQRMLGRADQQATTFHRLLAQLAPEDVRGVVLGDFLVGAPVGKGGFATVHVGRQLSTGRKVAIKLLNDGLGDDARTRFQQEAAFLSRVNDPAVVGVISYGEDAWSVPRFVDLKEESWFQELSRGSAIKTYIALEWIDGETLEQLYQRMYVEKSQERAALATIRTWFRDAAVALTAVHAAGLIHRDIKPANFMIDRDGRLRLMDFGIARSDDENRTLMTSTGYALGTPPYMSPEQLRAHDADAEVGPATDVYSLCATFYELVTGIRLFAHDRVNADTVKSKKLHGDTPLKPTRVVKDVPWELDTILLGGLEADVADRYPSASALARDIERWERDEAIEYRKPSLLRRAQLAYRRNRSMARLAAAFVAVLVVGTSFYITSVTNARDRADASARIAQQEKTRAEDRADLVTLAQARLFMRTDATRAAALVRDLGAKHWREVRAVAAGARAAGIASSLPASHETTTIDFDSTGKRILVAGSDGVVRLYDLSTKKIAVLARLTDAVRARFVRDEYAIVFSKYSINIVTLSSGERSTVPITGSVEVLTSAGDRVYWADSDGQVSSVSISEHPYRVERVELDEPVHELSASPDGAWLVLGGRNHCLLLDLLRSTPAQIITAGNVRSIAWTPDSEHLALLVDDYAMQIEVKPEPIIFQRWTVGTSRDARVIAGNLWTLTPSGVVDDRLGGHRRDIQLGLSMAETTLGAVAVPDKAGNVFVLSPYNDVVLTSPAPAEPLAFAASARSPYVVTAIPDRLLVWDVTQSLPARLSPSEIEEAQTATRADAGELHVSVTRDGSVELRDTSAKQSWTLAEGRFVSAVFSKDGRRVFGQTSGESVGWDVVLPQDVSSTKSWLQTLTNARVGEDSQLGWDDTIVAEHK